MKQLFQLNLNNPNNPEDDCLSIRDLFFVKYSAAPGRFSDLTHIYTHHQHTSFSFALSLSIYIYIYIGQQADLALHRDGSLLSFNVLLNPVSDFKGGGTYIKPLNQTFQIKQGSHDNPINNCYNHLYNLMIYDKLFET